MTNQEAFEKWYGDNDESVYFKDQCYEAWNAALEYAVTEEVTRLRSDQEALMRRLLLAGEIFAKIERHPDQAERLAREALFGPDAEPLGHNGQGKPGEDDAMMHRLFDGSESELIDVERVLFEADAKEYGFDLTRFQCAAPEPWSEYADPATGHRWGGWLAARAMTSHGGMRYRHGF